MQEGEKNRIGRKQQIFCVDVLRRRLLGDEELVSVVLRAFCADVPAQVDALVRAFHEHDVQKMGQLVHKLKGAVGNISAEMLYKTLVWWEDELRDHPQRDFAEIMNAVQEDMDLLLREITQYI